MKMHRALARAAGKNVLATEKARKVPPVGARRRRHPRGIFEWFERNAETLTGRVTARPRRDEIDVRIAEHLIVLARLA